MYYTLYYYACMITKYKDGNKRIENHESLEKLTGENKAEIYESLETSNLYAQNEDNLVIYEW
jgi:hypothetical protein